MMNNSLWIPLMGIWCIGMVISLMIVRDHTVIRWLGIAGDLFVFSFLSTATILGAAWIVENSERSFGMPKQWMSMILIAILLRALFLLVAHHRQGETDQHSESCPGGINLTK